MVRYSLIRSERSYSPSRRGILQFMSISGTSTGGFQRGSSHTLWQAVSYSQNRNASHYTSSYSSHNESRVEVDPDPI